MAYAVYLMASAVHSSEAPDVHVGLCSALIFRTKTDESVVATAMGMTHLHCIAHAGICTPQSYHPDIAYKPWMADQVALIGPYIWDFLRQEPTLSLDAAPSPLMYDLSYSLEAILYGHTLDGVV